MAGTIKANTIQLGDSATATQNFVLQTNVDGTAKLARGNQGATTQDILTVDANGLVAAPGGRQFLTLGTTVATTSGTAVDFTGIPSWVKRITVMFDSVSLSGTSAFLIQLGSGTVQTTGYNGAGGSISNAAVNVTGFVNSTSGVPVQAAVAAGLWSGVFTICFLGAGKWAIQGTVSSSTASTGINSSSGSVTLSTPLDRVRITTVNGTDTFDAGSMNIMYEG